MGKSNRIRNQRATSVLTTPAAKKKGNGMPTWAINTIAILLAAVVLLSVVLGVLTANGVFNRGKVAMRSANFKVDVNMLSYFYSTQRDSFIQENESNLKYYGLDASKPLKDQAYPSTSESVKTWFDYMMNQTIESVKEVLVYCEEAHTRNITLSDEDKASIDNQLASYNSIASAYRVSKNVYYASLFGNGVTENDVRRALELTTLADKVSDVLTEEIKASITDEVIQKEYDSNKKKYDLIDYMYFSFDVTYEKAAKLVLGDAYTADAAKQKKEEIIPKFNEMVEQAKKDAEELAKITTAEEFEGYIYDTLFDEYYTTEYEATLKKSKLESKSLPTADEIAKIHEDARAYVLNAVKNGDEFKSVITTEGEGDAVVYYAFATEDFKGYEVIKEYSTVIDDTVKSVHKSMTSDKDTYFNDEAKYNENNEFLKWAFEADRKTGEIKTINAGSENVATDTDVAKITTFTSNVYFLKKAQYQDVTVYKDIAFMLFESEEKAKTTIEAFKDGITLEECEEVSAKNSGSYYDYENYKKGNLGVDAVDEWIFAEGRLKNSYTETPLKYSDKQYMVAYYYDDGMIAWKYAVNDALYADKAENVHKTLLDSYNIDVTDKNVQKVEG